MYSSIKAVVIISAMFTFLVLTAHGQDKKGFGFVEGQVTSTGGSQLNTYVEYKLTKRCGVFVWVLVSKDYKEAYGGPNCSVNRHLTVAVGVGIESPGKFRVGGSVWAGNDKVENFTAWEAAGSGPWYKSTTKIPVGKNIKVGVIAQRFKGVGAHGEYNFSNKPVQISGDLFFGNHKPILVVSVKYKFGF